MWTAGGKLFRFRRDLRGADSHDGKTSGARSAHLLGHFWLCERCSTIYTLRHEPDRGVVILLLRHELPAAANSMRLPAS